VSLVAVAANENTETPKRIVAQCSKAKTLQQDKDKIPHCSVTIGSRESDPGQYNELISCATCLACHNCKQLQQADKIAWLTSAHSLFQIALLLKPSAFAVKDCFVLYTPGIFLHLPLTIFSSTLLCIIFFIDITASFVQPHGV
jgi:hypothetical protein